MVDCLAHHHRIANVFPPAVDARRDASDRAVSQFPVKSGSRPPCKKLGPGERVPVRLEKGAERDISADCVRKRAHRPI